MNIKKVRWLIVLFFALAGLALLLNIKVTTKQGIDYQVQSIRIPLYLKILDFFDRHFNYIELVSRITSGSLSQQERALAIFKWTYHQIKPQPEQLPVVDDHVWSIIIRGYGAGEQSADVFTTLCNYAGMEAFYFYLPPQEGEKKLVASFVMIDGEWSIFDLQQGAYFKTAAGKLATIKDVQAEGWTVASINPASGDLKKFYLTYAKSILALDYNQCRGYSRGNRQAPFKRLIFSIKEMGENR
ncbi:hypothetical protein ACFL2I_00920 [Candidatus Omnitrophota bacterium]